MLENLLIGKRHGEAHPSVLQMYPLPDPVQAEAFRRRISHIASDV
jgi:hypothetical protein